MNTHFKKMICLLCAAALVLSLCGCGFGVVKPEKSDSKQEQPQTGTTGVSPAEPSPAPVPGEPAEPAAPELTESFRAVTLSTAADYNEVYSLFLNAGTLAERAATVQDILGNPQADAVNATAELYGDADLSALHAGFETGSNAVFSNGAIAFLSGTDLVLISASGGGSKELSRTDVSTELSGGWSGTDTPVAIFAQDQSLYIVTYESASKVTATGTISRERTHLKHYHTVNGKDPEIVSDIAQDGRYAGLAEVENKLYLLTYYGLSRMEQEDTATYVPSVMQNGEDTLLKPEQLYLSPETDSLNYTVLSSYDCETAVLENTLALTGYYAWSLLDGDTFYLARTGSSYAASDSYTEAQYSVTAYSVGSCTWLAAVNRTDCTVTGSCRLEGLVPDSAALAMVDGTLYVGLVSDRSGYCEYSDETYGFVNYLKTDDTVGGALYGISAALTEPTAVANAPENTSVYRLLPAGKEALLLGYDNFTPKYRAVLGESTFTDYSGKLSVPVACSAISADGSFLAEALPDGEKSLCLFHYDGTALTMLDSVAAEAEDGDIIFSDSGKYAAVPCETGYAVYTTDGEQLVSVGLLETEYHIAGMKLLDNSYGLYFCSESKCVATSYSLKVLAEIDFAFG